MIQFIKKACLGLMALTIALSASAEGDAKSTKTSGFDWSPVMEAIIQVESEGNPNTVSGNSVGVMQITPILVKDCNDILKRQKSKKQFTMADRFSVDKSKEMFLIIQKVLQESTGQDEMNKEARTDWFALPCFITSLFPLSCGGRM